MLEKAQCAFLRAYAAKHSNGTERVGVNVELTACAHIQGLVTNLISEPYTTNTHRRHQ